MFGVEKFVEAYIQSVVLKRTSESILTDFKRGSTLSDKSREKLVEEAVDRVFAAESGSADVINVVVADEN